MPESTHESTLRAIEQQYKATVEQLDSWGFFRNVAQYVKTVEDFAPTRYLVEELERKQAEARKPVVELSERATKELKEVGEKMTELSRAVKEQTEPMRRAIQAMQDRLSGRTLSSNPLYGLDSAIFEVAKQFKENGLADAIKQFADEQKRMQNIYGNYTFAPSLEKLDLEEKKIERLEQVEPWGAWSKLPIVKRMVYEPEVFAEELKEEVEADPALQWDFLNFRGVWGEMEAIRKGKKSENDVIYFKRGDFLEIMRRVHGFFMTELLKSAEIGPLDFDPVKSILSLAGKHVIISARSQNDPHELLKTMFKDKSKEWNTDEILDDWKFNIGETKEQRKSYQKKVYQAGKSANWIVAQETGIKDFLIVTTKTIAINSQYLQP